MLFKGTGVALVTPFCNDGKLDLPALTRLIDHVVQGGVDYIVVQGTTGESATLNPDERRKVFAATAEHLADRAKLVVGLGGNNTDALLNDVENIDLSLFDGILSVSPYYNKPTQAGIYRHYAALAKATDKPIILYNIPGRTASNITVDTMLQLAADFKNIVAVKEASGNLPQIMEMLQRKSADFALLSGDDALTWPLLALGAAGVISVTANAFPRTFCGMVNAGLQGDVDKARRAHFKLLPLFDLLFQEGNPAGIKAALAIKKIIDSDVVRLPLVKASPALREKLAAMNFD